MKTTIALAAVLALSACATSAPPTDVKQAVVNQPAPPRAPVVPVIDEKCKALSITAKTIAILRDAGADKDEALLMVKPTDFPLPPMIREVYSRKDITPDVGATNSYTVCTTVGHDDMVTALVKANDEMNAAAAQLAKDELAAKRLATKKPVKKAEVKKAEVKKAL
jgi:hypothetical protein